MKQLLQEPPDDPGFYMPPLVLSFPLQTLAGDDRPVPWFLSDLARGTHAAR